MLKLYSFILLLLLTNGCAENGKINLELGTEESKFTLQPKNKMTTDAQIRIDGYIDCPVTVGIPGVNTYSLDTGKVSFEIWCEWYNDIREIRIRSEGCSEESNLTFRYKFVYGIL